MNRLGLLFFLSILTFGCSTTPQPMRGIIYTNVSGPNQAVEGTVAHSKRGEACTRTLLSLWSWGDASIAAAKSQGNITQIGAIDYKHMSVLSFVYTHTCTIVSGV